MLLLSAKNDPALSPMAMLELPEALGSAPNPIATLLLPLPEIMALKPMATL